MGARGLNGAVPEREPGDGITGIRTSRLLLAPILILLAGSSISMAQTSTAYDGPGFEAYYPDGHMLFLKGDDDFQYLDRNWTTVTGLPSGSITFSKTSSAGSPTIIEAQTPPIQESLRYEGNISVQIFASLEASSDVCSLTNLVGGTPIGSETQFTISLTMGGVEVMSTPETNAIVMNKGRTDPHVFLAAASNVNVTMSTGDTVVLTIQVRHECALTGTLWWGTYDARTGVLLEGDIIETELDVVLDQNRMARVEFTPISPWGPDDFSNQAIELIGPIGWGEMRHGHYEEDIWQDHFEIPHGTSTGESNRTVLLWSTESPLPPGNYMIDACFTLTDQDPGELCDSWAILRFNVPEDTPPLLDGFWAAAIVPLCIIAWIGFSLKGAMLPLPAYAVLLLLALASLGPAMHLPDIEFEPYREGGAAPSFILLSHNPDSPSLSLSELLDETEVVVLGIFTPGSPNAMRQMDDFESAKAIIGEGGSNPNFVQMATGEGLQAVNLDEYAQVLNGTWPLLMDDSTVGRALPSGATDAVVVIDSAGFITEWQPGSMSPAEIRDAVDSAAIGSGNSPLTVLSLLLGSTLLPLLVLAMPSDRRYEAPEEALIPGVGGFMTIGAASVGFVAWALPIASLSVIGLGAYWIFVEALLAALLIYHGSSMVSRGRIMEVEAISGWVHSNLPVAYREWRTLPRFTEDIYLGLWLAWLVWLRAPSMIPQGVGAVARSGMMGMGLAPFLLFGFAVCAGVAVLIVRTATLLPGSASRIFGLLSVGVRPRAWGLATVVMGLWILTSIIVGPMASSM
ncbi:MAG: hypothetical protein QGG76_01435 [Candidatus Thalassarchaeaceae archaeon]|nr:hypothetical protein [Candidatus Thalassarchaeaceae archaeon]